MKKQKRNRSTDEQFVKAWVKGVYHSDVAKRLGITIGAVYQRARFLRDAGVKLPILAREHAKQIDVAVLNALLKK